MLSERISRLNQKIRDTPVTLCLDRARLIHAFYQQPSMEPFILRRAKSFAYVLDRKKIFIDDDSLLAGHLGSRIHAAPLYPEMTAWLRDDIENLDQRESDNLQFLPGEKEELRQMISEWEGKTFGDLTAELADADINTMVDIGIFTKGVSNKSTMNHAPFYDEIVTKGYRYYIDLCKKNIDGLDDMDIEIMEKRYTWQAMIIVMEAIVRFAHRYADLAEELADACTVRSRKKNCSFLRKTAEWFLKIRLRIFIRPFSLCGLPILQS